MSLKTLTRSVLRSAGNLMLDKALLLLCSTLKVEVKNGSTVSSLEDEGKNYILAFWHGVMLLPWYQHRKKNMAALVSQSKDGELLSRVLGKWGFSLIRGSSSKGGSEALQSILKALSSGKSIAITPDGPRGPAHQFKPGAAVAAQRAQVPLVLLSVFYENKRRLRSWDSFEVPMPFSRVRLVYSDAIVFPAGLSKDEVSSRIEDCRKYLNSLV